MTARPSRPSATTSAPGTARRHPSRPPTQQTTSPLQVTNAQRLPSGETARHCALAIGRRHSSRIGSADCAAAKVKRQKAKGKRANGKTLQPFSFCLLPFAFIGPLSAGGGSDGGGPHRPSRGEKPRR